jgi:hypothetical protein
MARRQSRYKMTFSEKCQVWEEESLEGKKLEGRGIARWKELCLRFRTSYGTSPCHDGGRRFAASDLEKTRICVTLAALPRPRGAGIEYGHRLFD